MSTFSSVLYRYNLPVRGGRLASLIEIPLLWLARARQRRALGNLDDRLLRDIGIGRIDAEFEMRKPFWQA